MSYLTLIITIPLTLFVLLFAASNTGDVTLALWPFDGEWQAGLWLVGVGMLIVGFLLGALFVSILAQKTRFRYWQERKRSARLEAELEKLNKIQIITPQQNLEVTQIAHR